MKTLRIADCGLRNGAKSPDPQKKGPSGPQLPHNFRAQMTQMRNSVLQRLQLDGAVSLKPAQANELDWTNTLAQLQAEITEQCRFDINDPVVNKSLQRRLAITAAACEMWADQLEGKP